ncbi:MAG: hypothetical protein KatS3mg105_1068 [Gemmatales bacterium]|nr:MAG: hypothetical protein KatS3mg105_1068 [Gemmatales bacterium]
MPAADYLGDIVLELDVTPNMARCLSMIGVARETAALTGQKLRYPARKLHATGEAIAGQVEVIIEDEKLSRRYAAALIRGVKIGPSPGWMQRRLLYAGMRPINNIVDITNYIMLEWGQPLHAFDFDLLLKRAEGRPPRITVRPALKGEFITTLDGQKRGLVPADVVIADSAGPIALAGVMGGADTEVNEQTTNVLLESANFDAVSIRQTARRLDLPSEASMRFSRGVHPEIVFPAAEHACELMRCFAGGTVCQGFVDTYPAPIQVKPIELEMSEIRRLLGIDLSPVEAGKILRALEFDVEASDLEDIRVVPPPHRLDIQDEAADLLEELVRIHGYDKLPATLLADQLPDHPTDVNLLREEQLRDLLVQVGLQEVITYSLTQRSRETPFRDNDDDEYISIRNPISSERTVMRRHLLSGVIEIAALNLRHTENVRVFEIGSVYLPRPNDPLPDEPRRLALLLTGYRHDEHWSQPLKRSDNDRLDFFDMKGIIEAILDEFHIDNAGFRPATARYLHPGQSAELVINNLFAGTFGRMHPRLAARIRTGPPTYLHRRIGPASSLSRHPGSVHLYACAKIPGGTSRYCCRGPQRCPLRTGDERDSCRRQ